MAVATLWVSELTRQRLGDDGLAELAACLWVDCQSCGRLLGDDPPAVCVDVVDVVDVVGGVGIASLHHPRCRLPGWNESRVVVAGSGQYTTFVARMLLLPVTVAGGAREEWPLMVVNSSLECAHVEQDDDGRWQVSPDRSLVQAGLARLGSGLPLGVPSDGLVARLTDSTVAVVLQTPPFTVYEAPADEQLLGQARAVSGVLFAVTPTLNPGDLDAGELRPALADPRTLAGWAALHAPRHGRRRLRLRPQIWLLHWNISYLSIGKLIRLAPGRLTDEQARSWAERIISRGAPLTWQPVRTDRPDDGWQVPDHSSGLRYVIRRHADGWNLVQVCGQAAGERAETDNEAKAWAAGVLKLHAGVPAVTWRPAPSTPDSVTFYGIT
jgi:hypothetical protein